MSLEREAEMGGKSEEESHGESSKADDDEQPMDLSMPRFDNGPKPSRAGNSYISGRNKSAPSYEVDSNEQPIDYSKKYVESNSLSSIKTNYVPRNSLNKVKVDHREREKRFSQQEPKGYPYGDYAETDLDQPTDYSLRYAEDDTDDEDKDSRNYFAGNEQEDTVKTYCTEGTPYETPFNVSTATSMSDLRVDESKDHRAESSKKLSAKIGPESPKDLTKVSAKGSARLQRDKETQEVMTKERKNLNNELMLNSSNASIEKPTNYYDEGTPGVISRVSSLSSLGCAANGPTGQEPRASETIAQPVITEALEVSRTPPPADKSLLDAPGNDEETVIGGSEEEKGDSRSVDKEGKVVTFGGEDHYAEQTPLMFSRSSSLGSLSGFEQHSIHDDRSSIVSDFSRRTSGIVSPSELPDSPTQTIPPSPIPRSDEKAEEARGSAIRHFSYVKTPPVSKASIFEDNVAAFKEESTPIEFSAATSLSSLTIDDEPKIRMDAESKVLPEKAAVCRRNWLEENEASAVTEEPEEEEATARQKADNGEKNDVEGEKVRSFETDRLSDGDEDDEDILAACISMGMRNSMYPRQSSKEMSEKQKGDSSSNLVRYETSSTLDRLVGDVSALSLSSPIAKPKNSVETPPDTLCVYCTEDTPADISPAGSRSNLSALSLSSISDEIDREERNEEMSGDDEKILDDCIRSGIARARLANHSFPGTAAVSQFHSPRRVASTNKPEDSIFRSVSDERQTLSTSARTTTVDENNGRNATSPNHSDDEDILNQCIQSAMPKASLGSLSFAKASRKTPEESPRRAKESFGSRIAIPADDKSAEEQFGDNSSLSEDEEDLILAQCIRSGMPKASSMPSKEPNYQRDERRSREQ